jgi:hypothetical protein
MKCSADVVAKERSSREQSSAKSKYKVQFDDRSGPLFVCVTMTDTCPV